LAKHSTNCRETRTAECKYTRPHIKATPKLFSHSLLAAGKLIDLRWNEPVAHLAREINSTSAVGTVSKCSSTNFLYSPA